MDDKPWRPLEEVLGHARSILAQQEGWTENPEAVDRLIGEMRKGTRVGRGLYRCCEIAFDYYHGINTAPVMST